MRSLLTLIPLVMLLAACASGKTVVESDLGIRHAPDWVNKGSHQSLDDKGNRLFHGVGFSAPVGDMGLQISIADDRARTEIARMLSSYIDAVSQDYSGSTGSNEDITNEQSISREIRNVTKVNLVGSRIIGRWLDKKGKNVYSIAELDLDRVKDTVAKTNTMNSMIKNFMLKKSDTIFDRQL